MEQKLKSQKVRWNEKIEEYAPDEWTRQNPRKTIDWSRCRQPLRKRILNNDSEDLRKKKMEAGIEKMQGMFNKDLEELKNKQR